LLNDPPIIPSTVLLRRSLYHQCGMFDTAVRYFEDTDFFLRLAAHCRFVLVPTPLIYKRNRRTSITGERKDLMAHHAFVAFRAAADDPRLLPLVPRRLSERARKLGNHRFLMGDEAGAVKLLNLAVRLNLLNLRAWVSLTAAAIFPRLALRLLGGEARRRQTAMGANKT
jgi:hypothetical protein